LKTHRSGDESRFDEEPGGRMGDCRQSIDVGEQQPPAAFFTRDRHLHQRVRDCVRRARPDRLL
jgi:hypothetical protein